MKMFTQEQVDAFLAEKQAEMDAALKAKGKPFTVQAQQWKDGYTLALEGNFKPFTKGVGTILQILDNADKIRAVVAALPIK